MVSPGLRILTRADDAGLNIGTNEGIALAATQGVARNISVLANGPAVEDAAARLKDLDVCFGFHACLTSEWESPRWGSLSTPDLASPLHDEEGKFPRDWAGLQRLDPPGELVLAEMQAQLDRLRDLGFPLRYMDEHMVISAALPRLRPLLASFAKREGLIYRMEIPGMPAVPFPGAMDADDDAGYFLQRLRAASPGVYVEIAHPALPTPEMQDLCLKGQPKGKVAREREKQVLMFTSPAVREFFALGRARAIRYDEI